MNRSHLSCRMFSTLRLYLSNEDEASLVLFAIEVVDRLNRIERGERHFHGHARCLGHPGAVAASLPPPHGRPGARTAEHQRPAPDLHGADTQQRIRSGRNRRCCRAAPTAANQRHRFPCRCAARTLTTTGTKTISIYGPDGRRLMHTTQAQVDLSTLPRGLYLIKMTGRSGIKVIKVRL